MTLRQSSIIPPTGVATRNDQPFPVGLPPPGQLFITANLKDVGLHALGNLSVGLGLQNLFGFAAKYPRNGPFASAAVTFAQFPLIDIKPTVAYKVTERLSVGLGADIFTFVSLLGEGHLEQQSVQGGNTIELNGKGTTAGLNASLLYTLLQTDDGKPRLNFAFIWRSQAVLPIDGVFLVDGALVANTSSSIRLPEIYTWGVAFWPIRDAKREWKVEVDVDYAPWGSIRDFNVRLSNGVTLANPQQWSNAASIGLGTEYRWLSFPGNPNWNVALRTGYLHSQQAIPDVKEGLMNSRFHLEICFTVVTRGNPVRIRWSRSLFTGHPHPPMAHCPPPDTHLYVPATSRLRATYRFANPQLICSQWVFFANPR